MTAVASRSTGNGVAGAAGGCYVYGIAPAEVALPNRATTIGGDLRLVRHGRLAAVTSPVGDQQPLGTRRAMAAHIAVLDALALVGPVLPLRFGTVVPTERELVDNLLGARQQEFGSALVALARHAQFRLDARYVEEVVLGEIVRADPMIRRLRDRLHGRDDPALRAERVQLGEAVARALGHQRDLDIGSVLEELREYCAAAEAHVPDTANALVSAAFLVRDTDRQAFEDAVERLGERWRKRARLRLLGPTAPYDFTDWALSQPAVTPSQGR